MGWAKHSDGSLRGSNAEFVMKSPQNRKDISRYINYLKNALERNGINILDSDRTGVHIHLNVQDWEITSILNFMILYLMLEIPLVKWCGENRSGNMFCLRSIDASHLVLMLNSVFEKGDIQYITTDSYRYSSINPAALRKYGSLEFRAMRTPTDLSRINTWIKILLKIKDASLSFRSTSDMIDGLSQNGIRPFIRSIFGYTLYKELIDNYEGDVEEDVLESVRLIQPIAYSEFIETPKKSNQT